MKFGMYNGHLYREHQPPNEPDANGSEVDDENADFYGDMEAQAGVWSICCNININA
jgi:hypothetical protein